jgi:hypothetical protein
MAEMKNSPPPLKTLAFHREYGGLRGGHLKVWHYFCHAKASRVFRPTIHFAPSSILDESNPWSSAGEPIRSAWEPDKADALFLAGMDWMAVPESCTKPVLNLIQGFRHTDSGDPRFQFLQRRAIRICVSGEVADEVLSTGMANGPVITIPAALDLELFPEPSQVRDIPILIVGLKRPGLAEEIAADFFASGFTPVCLTRSLPRLEFLRLLGRSMATVFLPLEKEGFYLPALEGMAMETIVVCPDSEGNRSFCLDGVNCLRPDAGRESIVATVLRTMKLPSASQEALRNAARETVNEHRLARERERFLEILDQVGDSI